MTRVDVESELQVGVDGIGTAVLESVRVELRQQADAAPLVAAHVDDRSSPGGGDASHGCAQLLAAVASQAAEGVAGEAL